MKKAVAIGIGVCLIMALALGSVGCVEGIGAADTDALGVTITSEQNTGIWVSGVGKMTLAPDLAQLDLGVRVEKESVAEAQSEAARVMNAVVAALVAEGVEEKDIQTTWFSIEPVYQWDKETWQQILVAYRVSNTVRVNIHDIASAGRIIDSATAAGGDYMVVNALQFTVDEVESYYTELRELAMADAKAKAEQLALLSGVMLGAPTYISEGGGSAGLPVPIYRSVAEGESTPILPGQMEIALSVQVVYSIN